MILFDFQRNQKRVALRDTYDVVPNDARKKEVSVEVVYRGAPAYKENVILSFQLTFKDINVEKNDYKRSFLSSISLPIQQPCMHILEEYAVRCVYTS